MENKIIMLKTETLEHHPDNPRKNIGDVSELSASIKAKGILQNLTVVPSGKDSTYYVVIGNRRLEASKAAGLEEVPCVISDMDYKTQIETMMVENIQREDLTVIEQAEGMQMMLDLGSTVEEISDKTGFSESTVRRRLKLNEYDRKKVVEGQERGATLEDFIKLEQIKQKSERNRLIKIIGTADFNLEYKRAFDTQKNNELKKLAIKELETFAEPLPESENTWSQKWNEVERLSYPVLKFEKGKRVPKTKSKKYYYRISQYYDGTRVRVFTRNESYKEQQEIEKPKKTEKQKEVDRAVRQLNKIAKEHYELRTEFILSIAKRSTIKDYEHICFDTIIRKMAEYGYINNNYAYNDIINKFLGIDYYNSGKLLEAYNNTPAGTAVIMVYRMLEDSEGKNCYYKYYDSSKVTFRENKPLNLIYDFLISLGYEMSEEEQKITNGTYELYDRETSAG